MSSQYDLIGQQNHFEIYFNQLSILKDGDFTHSSGFIRFFLEKKEISDNTWLLLPRQQQSYGTRRYQSPMDPPRAVRRPPTP